MDSLVGYGSDDEVESDRHGGHHSAVSAAVGAGGARRRQDDTNYDDVNMDMSEDSQGAESEPELPPAEPAPASSNSSQDDRRSSNDSRDRDRDRPRDPQRRDRRRESPPRPPRDAPAPAPARDWQRERERERERPDRRSPRKDDRYRSERGDRSERTRGHEAPRRGLLGDRPDDKVPALMDLKPFGGEPPPNIDPKKSHDARDAVSPRFVDRDRRDRDRDRERDRDRHSRRSEERRSSSHRQSERRSRSRSRGAAFPPPPPPAHTHPHPHAPPPAPHAHAPPAASAHPHLSSNDRRPSPTTSNEYRPSSYKVNKKLEVMEKMGLQIKTPDGSMATAQQLRAAAGEAGGGGGGGPGGAPHQLPSYYNPTAVNTNKILNQVQKRKLLWSGKNKSEAEEAAKWSGARFAQDSDGRQVSKFMRLMGIKEPAAVKPEPTDKTADPVKNQEELFQAMQAQYEVARATTHTMRGVGLGFQRGQY